MLDNNQSYIPQLIALLDDPDPTVHTAVIRQLSQLSEDEFERFCLHIHTLEPQRQNTILPILQQLTGALAIERIKEWRNNSHPEMLRGIYLIQNVFQNSEAPFDALQLNLLDNVKDVWLELSDNQTILEKVHLFNHYFYTKIGYKVVDPMLQLMQFVHLDKAVLQKIGNTVIMTILYIYYAEQLSLPIHGYVFKGGFIPCVLDENGEIRFYVNVYKHGTLFGKEQLNRFLKDYGFNLEKADMKEADAVSMATIYTEVLYYIFSSRGNQQQCDTLEKILDILGKERYLIIEEDDD